MTDFERVALDVFDSTVRPFLTEVSSSALGGSVLSCSDDFFASKDNLIKPSPSQSMKGLFGPNGALYDGWESRRHNPAFDWVIILLAPAVSHLDYFDIDTSHFSGNEAPASQVFALTLDRPSSSKTGDPHVKLSPTDKRWEEVLPVVELGPNSRHIFKLGKTASGGAWSALMVRMIPDGGMARFRAYGRPLPPALLQSIPDLSVAPINLLSPLFGARVIACSDANFSPPGNLLLPGRGVDMSDGWETRRSQVGRGKYGKAGAMEGQERSEWVVLKMATSGVIRHIEVDTAYHPGNYPVACQVQATLSTDDLPGVNAKWTTIVHKKPLGAHRQHWLDVERNVAPDAIFSHVRYTIFPDGGTKRLRVYGHPVLPQTQTAATTSAGLTVTALPVTEEAFRPYGEVIQGFSLPTSGPRAMHVTGANQGTAAKFHRMAHIKETYPAALLKGRKPYIRIARKDGFLDARAGTWFPVGMFEQHPHTTQAWIPMLKSVDKHGTEQEGRSSLVVVALNGPDDKPDLSTLRAFTTTSAQGVSYNQGIWHHNLFPIDSEHDFLRIESQIEGQHELNVEVLRPTTPFATIYIPPNPTSMMTSEAPNGVVNGHHKESMSTAKQSTPSSKTSLVPRLITAEAFAPFGRITQFYPSPETVDLGDYYVDIVNEYPPEAGAVTGISVFRATPKIGLVRGEEFAIQMMERHPFTSQAFIPMDKGEVKGHTEEALPAGGQMLVIVAKGGKDDRPDPSTLEAFLLPPGTGISYNMGTWHHPSLVLDEALDLACIETQISTGIPEPDPRDCELVTYDRPIGMVSVPF